jgi:signal peptidase I
MLQYFVSESDIRTFKRLTLRQKLIQFVNAGYAIVGTYIIWKTIALLLNNDSPIVVVLSESMAPGFRRGDILWLANKDFSVGSMTVFQMNNGDIPCVHRCIRQFGDKYLTKGDNNRTDDVGLYRSGRSYLSPGEIKSTVVGYIPFFGNITLWINAVPAAKPLILGLVGISVFFTREE